MSYKCRPQKDRCEMVLTSWSRCEMFNDVIISVMVVTFLSSLTHDELYWSFSHDSDAQCKKTQRAGSLTEKYMTKIL